PVRRLKHVVEPKHLQCPAGPLDDLRVGVRHAPDALAIAALRVEDSCEETLVPFLCWFAWPVDQPLDGAHSIGRGTADGGHLPAPACRCRERDLLNADAHLGEIFASSCQCLRISESEPELVVHVTDPVAVLVSAASEMAVSTHHAAEISAPVVCQLLGRFREPPEPHELVVDSEERALLRP